MEEESVAEVVGVPDGASSFVVEGLLSVGDLGEKVSGCERGRRDRTDEGKEPEAEPLFESEVAAFGEEAKDLREECEGGSDLGRESTHFAVGDRRRRRERPGLEIAPSPLERSPCDDVAPRRAAEGRVDQER